MSALLILVLEIMRSFGDRLTQSTSELGSGGLAQIPDLPVFQSQDTGLVSQLVLGTVIILTIANSLAPKFAIGGHALNAVFYGSIMCIMTGLNLLLLPPISQSLLTI